MNSNSEWLRIIIEIAEILVNIIGILVFKNSIAIVFAILILVIFSFLLRRYIKQTQYIRFVEYLIRNDSHCFALLPKTRMYLQIVGRNNIKIEKMSVKYTITPSDGNIDNTIMGDMLIEYSIQILNKNLPNKFQFIYANDFSNKNIGIEYKYSDAFDYQILNSNTEQLAPYWRGAVRIYDIGFEKNKLTQSKHIELKIKVSCDKSFDFSNLARDTIVFLPLSFGNEINDVDYTIDASQFKNKRFYCDAWRICSKNMEYSRSSIECERRNNCFASTFSPASVLGEQAYYFRIGLGEIDVEYRN